MIHPSFALVPKIERGSVCNGCLDVLLIVDIMIVDGSGRFLCKRAVKHALVWY